MRVAVPDVVDLPDYTVLVQGLGNLLIYLPNLLTLPFTLAIKSIIIDYRNERKALFFS